MNMEQNYLGYGYTPIYHQLQAQSLQNEQNQFAMLASEPPSENQSEDYPTVKREIENDPQVMNQFLPSIFNHHAYHQAIPPMPWENNFNYHQYQPYGAMNYRQPPPFDPRFIPQPSIQYSGSSMHGFAPNATVMPNFQQSFMRQNGEGLEMPSSSSQQVGNGGNVGFYTTSPPPPPSIITQSIQSHPQPSKSHQSYHCQACDKTFTTSTHYKRHLNTKSHQSRSSVATINLSDLSKASGVDPVIIKTGNREIQITFSQQNNPITDLSEAEVVLIDKIEKELSGIEPSILSMKEEISASPSPLGAVSSSSASENGEFCCLLCNKSFAKKCYLTQHNKTAHIGSKPFKCSKCGKKYETNEALNEHLNKHTDVKPFKCKQCPKAFVHKTDLKRHEILHQAEKPHVCSICGKGFIRNDHLVKHIQSHKKKMERMEKIFRSAAMN